MVNSTKLKNLMDDIRTDAFSAIKEILWGKMNECVEFSTPVRFTEHNIGKVVRSIQLNINEAKIGSPCGVYLGIESLNELSTELYISILEELEKNTHSFPKDNEE